MKRIRGALDRWSSFRQSSGSCQIRGVKLDADAGPLRAFLCDWVPFAHPLPADEPTQIFNAPDTVSTLSEQGIKTIRIPGTNIEVTSTMTLGEYHEELKKAVDRMNCEELYNHLNEARIMRRSIIDPVHFLLTDFIVIGSKKLRIECPSWHDKLKERYGIKDLERLPRQTFMPHVEQKPVMVTVYHDTEAVDTDSIMRYGLRLPSKCSEPRQWVDEYGARIGGPIRTCECIFAYLPEQPVLPDIMFEKRVTFAFEVDPTTVYIADMEEATVLSHSWSASKNPYFSLRERNEYMRKAEIQREWYWRKLSLLSEADMSNYISPEILIPYAIPPERIRTQIRASYP